MPYDGFVGGSRAALAQLNRHGAHLISSKAASEFLMRLPAPRRTNEAGWPHINSRSRASRSRRMARFVLMERKKNISAALKLGRARENVWKI